MKKVLLPLVIIILTAFFVSGQSFTLSWNGETLGDTLTVGPDEVPASEIVFQAIVHNNTNNGSNIKVLRNEILMLEGTSSYFKWGPSYFNDTTNLSPNYEFVPAGGSSVSGKFSGNYKINGAVGVSIIEYTFFNKDNTDENVKIVVKFDSSPEAIDENILKNTWISEIYPNPATNFVAIDYDIPLEVNEASVRIVNLLGSVLQEQKIDASNNSLKMNIQDMRRGIYFYSITFNGEIYSTKKLIIR